MVLDFAETRITPGGPLVGMLPVAGGKRGGECALAAKAPPAIPPEVWEEKAWNEGWSPIPT